MESVEKTIKVIFEECKERHHSQGYWINERIAAVAKHVIEEYDGDILEIGAGHGITTEKFLKHGRVVIVIDPFEDGYDYYPEGTENHKNTKPFIYPFEDFQRNCAGYSNLMLIKQCSQHMEVVKVNPEHKIVFAFVDGLQVTVEDVYHDLVLVESLGVKVISVDDCFSLGNPNRAKIVQGAVDKFVRKYNYKLVDTNEAYPEVRECYLIRKDK